MSIEAVYCDWTGDADDVDCYGQCPKCFEPTLVYPHSGASS